MTQKRPRSGQDQGNSVSSGGCQGTGPSLPGLRPQLVPSLTSQQRPRVSDQAWTSKGPPRPSHPRPPARPGRASSLPIPRLLVHICSLFRSATRRPLPPHACQNSWAFVASPRGGGSGSGGWAGKGPGRSAASPLHPGRPSKHRPTPRSQGEIVHK